MPLFFILFVVIPVIEILLLIKVGQLIGGWYTVGLVLLSAFVGVNMLRYQGVSTLTRAKQRMDRGEIPLGEMRDGIVIAVGGALLITPGFVTDFLGFCCLIPFTRHWLSGLFGALFKTLVGRSGAQTQFHYHQQSYRRSESEADRSGDVIDGEFVDVEEPESRSKDDNKRLH